MLLVDHRSEREIRFMGLMQRVERAQQGANGSNAAALIPVVPPTPVNPRGHPEREVLLRTVRMSLQAEIVGAFDALVDVPAAEATVKITELVDRVIKANGFAVTGDERSRLITEMVNDVTGLGPLESLLKDETITEVMVNGPSQIYIERAGKILRVDTHFLNNEHVLRIIDRIITPLGRRIDDSSPRVDARLADGSRVNAIIAPLSLVGPVITVRKFATKPYTVEDLIRFGTATPEMFDFLDACIRAKLNVFVSGGTGSGKTTTLNVISSFIPNDERIVTIEDAAELQLRQEHVVTLEARPPNLEGEGEITIRNLLRNAMHMRPDRIIVGECRAGEALDMLQAMTTGHDGSLSTGHANTPKDMLRRLETMILMTGYEMPLWAIREQIASAVDLIVHTARLKDGSRKIVNITEVFGIEDEEILTQDIFAFEQTGMRDGKVEGELKPTGYRPTFMPQFKRNGVRLPEGEFGIPSEADAKPMPRRKLKERWGGGSSAQGAVSPGHDVGRGRAVAAGGMIYVSAIGPVDRETGLTVTGGIKDQARRCLSNLKATLEEHGSSLEKVVWANWSLLDRTEFDTFYEEWLNWFPDVAPVGQGTLMPPPERRAGFRVSIGVIAQAG
jgi:pilus assembly protein CpaF